MPSRPNVTQMKTRQGNRFTRVVRVGSLSPRLAARERSTLKASKFTNVAAPLHRRKWGHFSAQCILCVAQPDVRRDAEVTNPTVVVGEGVEAGVVAG